MRAFDLVRTQEELFKVAYKDQAIADEEWVTILVENPKLLKRPIVVNGTKAILAQPAELIDKIL